MRRFLAHLVVALALVSCVRDKAPVPRGEMTISKEQQATWVRNFNPLSVAAPARWPTTSGIYEPLFVYSGVKGEYVPWLATAFSWSEDRRTLRMTTRKGVTWSDGATFSAGDVAFTFELLRRYPALDRRGVKSFVADVRAIDESTVEFSLSRVFLPGFDEIAPQPIVPRHIWKDVADPVTFANENPVATGPFTEVRSFTPQLFVLGKNPRYWQPGKPALDALRFPAYPNNDRANLALAFGEIDWAANFVPAIDRVFVGRDPEHNAYWFPLTGSTIFLYANAARAPFTSSEVRKAVSMAIDRALLIDVALHGYSRPSDATALCDGFASWRDASVLEAGAGDWVRFDPKRAAEELDKAGYTISSDGFRHGPDGRVLRHEIMTVSGWSDWVRAAQVIARGLVGVGIDAQVRTFDFGAWFQRLSEGDFDLSLGWSVEGPTPYVFYRSLMASATVKPAGQAAEVNWHRFASAEADKLLHAFEREADPVAQHRIMRELERVFVASAPAIPLYPNPSWAEFSTRRVTGFPSASRPYADPSPNKSERGENLLVLTALEPR